MHALRDHRDFPTAWRRDPFDRTAAIDALMTDLAALGAIAASSSRAEDWLARNLTEIARFAEEMARLEGVQGRDYDGLEARLRDLTREKSWGWKGFCQTTFGDHARDAILARRDAIKAKLDSLIADCDADLAPLIHEALREPVTDYEVLKAGSGQLDFLDLLVKARDLIRHDHGVRAELQQRFTHFFVDEFQDTDPLQVEILLLLAADDPTVSDWHLARPIPGKLFLVGDPKQSVYRFRRADIALYEEVKRRLLSFGGELLNLTTSFRAPASIQSFVNGAFAPAMPSGLGGSSQAVYVPLEPFRAEITDRPTLVALPVPSPYSDYGKIVRYRIDGSFPQAVGAFVDWLVNSSGWTVDERGGTVPVRPRHVAILFRQFRNFGSDVTRPYVRALEARHIPHVLVGGRSFHDREEVIAIRNALVAIEWPDDELRVFATLRGPFFAIGDEALLAFRQSLEADGSLATRHLNPMRSVNAEELPAIAHEVSEALALLAQLHVGRNHRPIAQTITMLLTALRAHAGTALWPNGEQALANCQRLIDVARHFEHGASSFRAFVEKLESDAEHGEADEAPIIEEGTEGVRVMTVHKAKGLEFPVVILADPACRATHDKPSRHVDPDRHLWLEPVCLCSPIELLEAADEELKADQDEAIRLAYVAATRARDLLVLPVCGDQPIEGWLSALDPMLYPPNDARRNSDPAPGCPAFGDDSVLDRGPNGSPPPNGAVKPGSHRPSVDGPPIVWWDPATLNLEIEEAAPLQHQRLLEEDDNGFAAATSARDYEGWVSTKAETIATASRPSIAIQTVTTAARAEAVAGTSAPETASAERSEAASVPGEPPVQIERLTPTSSERPSGRRFGALVHAILASIDLDADVGAVRKSAAMNGKLVGATGPEIEAATQNRRRDNQASDLATCRGQ